MNSLIKYISSNCSIVGLGDFSHGTRESWKLKGKFIKMLSKKKNKIDIFIEDVYPRIKKLNDYIHNVGGSLKLAGNYDYHNTFPLMEYIGYRIYDSIEFLEFIKLLKKLNSTKDKDINIYGVDVLVQNQGLNTTIDDIFAIYPQLEEDKSDYAKYLIKNSTKYKNRDIFMADSITYLYKKRKRLSIFLGHNYHISTHTIAAGDFLKSRFKNKYIVIGTASSGGVVRIDGEFNDGKLVRYKKPKVYKFVDKGSLRKEIKEKTHGNYIFKVDKDKSFSFFILGFARQDYRNLNEYDTTVKYDYIIYLFVTNPLTNIVC